MQSLVTWGIDVGEIITNYPSRGFPSDLCIRRAAHMFQSCNSSAVSSFGKALPSHGITVAICARIDISPRPSR